MGDPKKHRKKYSAPRHPWKKERIEEERELVRQYGTKNKHELWKMNSKLKKFKEQAKLLITQSTAQAAKEKKQLFDKLCAYGFLDADADLGDVLTISMKDVMERRLQTRLVRLALARTVKQARQFITHCHVKVAGKVITSPSYLVKVTEDTQISFVESSALFSTEHPERAVVAIKGEPAKGARKAE